MTLLIRKARIIDSKSEFHNQIVDLQIESGIFTKIEAEISNSENFEELQLDNLHVSQGWFDCSVSLGEPGFEDRETIANGLEIAAKSGFTAIALQPNSYPIIDNQSHINFVKSKATNSATNLYPIGALTKNSEGKDLAELYDMKNAGAIAFGDYNKNIDNPNLLKIALQYVQDFDGLVCVFCEDANIKGTGVANEGIVSTGLGLKGISNLAEELIVARNLDLLEYTGGKLHIATLSTAKSVALIRTAKANGLQVTCSVAVHHLVMTDEKLQGFDSRYKVSPPLRTRIEQKALLDGLKNGTIDMITSDHNPIDIEHKKIEFDMAKNGTIGLETAFSALQNMLPTELIIEKLTSGKSIFGIENNEIKVGAKAEISFFCPTSDWVFSKTDILSKSKNTCFLGEKMKGKVYGVFNNSKLVLNG